MSWLSIGKKCCCMTIVFLIFLSRFYFFAIEFLTDSFAGILDPPCSISWGFSVGLLVGSVLCFSYSFMTELAGLIKETDYVFSIRGSPAVAFSPTSLIEIPEANIDVVAKLFKYRLPLLAFLFLNLDFELPNCLSLLSVEIVCAWSATSSLDSSADFTFRDWPSFLWSGVYVSVP